MRTHVRLVHERSERTPGGSQSGGSGVTYRTMGTLVPIVTGGQPTLLTCSCGARFEFRLRPLAQRRRIFWQRLRKRGFLLLAGSLSSGVGAWTALTPGHPQPIKIIGWILYIPGMILALGSAISLLGCWPVGYSLEPLPGSKKTTSTAGSTTSHRPRFR